MCGVSDLDHAGAGGRPAGLRVSPEELEVDDGVGRGGVDEFLEDGRPFVCFHARHRVHALEDFFFVNGVVPVFFLGASDL